MATIDPPTFDLVSREIFLIHHTIGICQDAGVHHMTNGNLGTDLVFKYDRRAIQIHEPIPNQSIQGDRTSQRDIFPSRLRLRYRC